MAAQRRFDWDEARTLHRQGVSYKELAAKYGVTAQAVRLAVDDDYRSARGAYHAQWQRSNRCVCGAQISRRSEMCSKCHGESRRSSVRKDTLRCSTCRQWKPDEDFSIYKSITHRRGRRRQCRSCDTIARAETRAKRRVPCASCGKPCGTLDNIVDCERRGLEPTGMCKECCHALITDRRKRASEAMRALAEKHLAAVS